MTRMFPLSGLLRLRHLEEDRAAAALAAANSRSRALNRRRDAALTDLDESPAEVSTAAALRLAAIARSSSRSMLADLNALEAAQEEETARAREEYSAAHARTVGLEKLESRHAEQVAAEDLHTEQTVLDEIGSAAWFRKYRQGVAL